MGTAAAVLEQYVRQTLLPQGLPIHIDFQVLLATTWLAAVFRPDPNPDPDPRVFCPPGSISQRYGSGSGSRKILNPTIL